MLYSFSAITNITLSDLDGAFLLSGTTTELLEPTGVYTTDNLRESNVIESAITGGTGILFGPNGRKLDTIKKVGIGNIVGIDSDNLILSSLSANTLSGSTFYSGSTDLSNVFISNGLGGEDNTASNLGGTHGVFAQKSGVDLQFKSLSAGTNLNLFSSSTENSFALADDIILESISAQTISATTLTGQHFLRKENTLINSQQDDFTPSDPTVDILRFTIVGGDQSLTGVLAPSPVFIKEYTLWNADVSASLLIQHNNTSSAAANRIMCPDDSQYNLKRNSSTHIQYDDTSSRWRIMADGA